MQLPKRYVVFFLLYALLLLYFYLPVSLPLPTTTDRHYLSDEGFIAAYFCQDIDCAQLLTSLLLASNSSVCAFYDLQDATTLQALHQANASVLLFEKNYDSALHASFTPVASKGLMHHKFCVFNETYVLTGTWNPTMRGTLYNDNYVLFIASPRIAKHYLHAYDYLQDRTMTISPLYVNLSGALIDVYFCPLHDCEQQVIATLQQANFAIRQLAFTFTSEPIAQELLTLALQGITVTVIFEKTRITRYSTYHELLKHPLHIYTDTNPYTMHEKLFLIDDELIIAGSYNPTAAATTINDENLLIISDSTLAQQFRNEFDRIHAIATLETP
jgi:phosphatidylserine/phosphatidylglycerophosphate/cardiolipin synthase-like enzyme